MTDEYCLWKVTFSYKVPSDLSGDRGRDVYMVVAQNKEEAKSKSFAHFSETPAYEDLRLSREGLVLTTVTGIKKRRLTLPQLTLPEDQEQFFILPRLSADNSSLEYIVVERKGK